MTEENRRPTCEELAPITEDWLRAVKRIRAQDDAAKALAHQNLWEQATAEEKEAMEMYMQHHAPADDFPATCHHLAGHPGPHEGVQDEFDDGLIFWARWYDGRPLEMLVMEYCDILLGPEGFDDNCCMLPRYHDGPHHNNGVTW